MRLKRSLKSFVAELCEKCGVIHDARCGFMNLHGASEYATPKERNRIGRFWLTMYSAISCLPDAEVYSIPSDNRGRNNYDESNHRVHFIPKTNYSGKYAEANEHSVVDVSECDRHCRAEDTPKRDAIACRKANELAW
jgi:hypothetical protein